MDDRTIPLQQRNERAAAVELSVLKGPHVGSRWRFSEAGRVVLGRGASANLRFPKEQTFSRLHCELEIDPPHVHFRDLPNTNGTQINGARAAACTLQDGDIITVGETQILISVSSGSGRLDSNRTDVPPQMELETVAYHAEHDQSLAGATNAEALDGADTLSTLPQRIGPYEVKALAGEGGMGVVVRAVHSFTGEVVAVKLLKDISSTSREHLQLFLRESSMTIKLDHPRIVRALQFGTHRRQPFLALEWLDVVPWPETLYARTPERRVRAAAWIGCRVLEALDYAHARGIVHRDVKPSNILGYIQDGKLQVKLADFGLAKYYADAGYTTMTAEGAFRGTLAYVAPEQFHNSKHAQPQSDIYSVGICVLQVLTKQLPFDNWSFAQIVGWMRNPRPLEMPAREHYPADLMAVVRMATHPQVSERYSTAAELHRELSRFL